MLSFYDILALNNLDPDRIKLVRHGNKEISILETFQYNRERLETYQSFQSPKKFHNTKYIAVFAPAEGTSALFLGLWDILDYLENKQLTLKHHEIIDRNSLPAEWHDNSDWYDLRHNPILEDYSERLVVEWGRATTAWVQKRDKQIIEIKQKNTVGEFESYDKVLLKYDRLKQLIKNPASNMTWVTALSSVNGVYLIRDSKSGMLYVGSAYGATGILGRWQSYANTGHGGNKELKGLNQENFVFSILEILPPNLSADAVVERENRWKVKIGSKEFGYNKN